MLDVPRDHIARLEEAFEHINDNSGLEIVNAVALTAGDTLGEVQVTELGRDATEADRLLGAALSRDAEDETTPVTPAGEDPRRAALFGAEAATTTLGDELIETARRLPESHAAVVIVLRHAWLQDLAALLSGNESDVLIDRLVDTSVEIDATPASRRSFDTGATSK